MHAELSSPQQPPPVTAHINNEMAYDLLLAMVDNGLVTAKLVENMVRDRLSHALPVTHLAPASRVAAEILIPDRLFEPAPGHDAGNSTVRRRGPAAAPEQPPLEPRQSLGRTPVGDIAYVPGADSNSGSTSVATPLHTRLLEQQQQKQLQQQPREHQTKQRRRRRRVKWQATVAGQSEEEFETAGPATGAASDVAASTAAAKSPTAASAAVATRAAAGAATAAGVPAQACAGKVPQPQPQPKANLWAALQFDENDQLFHDAAAALKLPLAKHQQQYQPLLNPTAAVGGAEPPSAIHQQSRASAATAATTLTAPAVKLSSFSGSTDARDAEAKSFPARLRVVSKTLLAPRSHRESTSSPSPAQSNEYHRHDRIMHSIMI
eukprot:NODE_8761_length_1472_cov_3.089219.p1 GENE.NODE_8761_length_1472_cov_3.089219~~NODE_8761_length_1472_cov_3.089219.p1  ORF type:complete len:378 (-),score=69.91 NODE_8761_length_1472_cov_3.089219:155-1288(-)